MHNLAMALRTNGCDVSGSDDEIYDRSADPYETINLIHKPELASTIAGLKEDIMGWLFETADVIPWKADPRFPKVPQGQHSEFHFKE